MARRTCDILKRCPLSKKKRKWQAKSKKGASLNIIVASNGKNTACGRLSVNDENERAFPRPGDA